MSYNGKDITVREQALVGKKRNESGGTIELERGDGSSKDDEVYDTNDGTSIEWDDEIDVDELINDAQEYDFNTQVEDEMAAYVDDEMLDDESGRSVSNDKDASEDQSCVIEQNNKRQKACPGQKKTYNNSDAVGCLCA